MGVVSSFPSLKGIYAILISPIYVTLLKILNCCLGRIGGLSIKFAQSMDCIICVEKIDFISFCEAIEIKEWKGVIPPKVDVTTYWVVCDCWGGVKY